MSAQPWVLSSLDEWIVSNNAKRPRGGEKVRMDQELEAVRAAVAELIAADVEYDEALAAFNKVRSNPPTKVEVRYARAIARRDAALAAVTKEQR